MTDDSKDRAGLIEDAPPKEVTLFSGGNVVIEKWFTTVDDALALALTDRSEGRAFILHLRSQSQPEGGLARSLRRASSEGKPLLRFAAADADGIPMNGVAVDAKNILRIGLVARAYPRPEDSAHAALSIGERVALENANGTTHRGAFIDRHDGAIFLEIDGSTNYPDPPIPVDEYGRLYRLER